MKRRTFLKAFGASGALLLGGSSVASAKRSPAHQIEVATKSNGSYFDPIGLFVEPGDIVRWKVTSGTHRVLSYSPDNPASPPRRIPNDAASWDSGPLHPGETFEHRITASGTYDYLSTAGGSVIAVGRLVCWEPGGPALDSPIPNSPAVGTVPDSDTIANRMKVSYPYRGTATSDGVVSWKPVTAFGGTGLASIAAYYLSSSEGRGAKRGPRRTRRKRSDDRG